MVWLVLDLGPTTFGLGISMVPAGREGFVTFGGGGRENIHPG